MVQAICQHAKSESLNMRHGLVPALPVRHHARKIGDFSKPPIVVLALDFDLEVHGRRQSNTGPCCRLTDRA